MTRYAIFSGYGRSITEEEAEQAFSLTDGWAIAVGALAVSGHTGTDKKIAENLLNNYIETQIWNKFDQDLRLFLLRTSIVDEFSAELSELLTQNPKAKEILDLLCEGDIFISSREGTYHYHRLFLAFLRKKAEEEIGAGQGPLYQTAAQHYLEKKEFFNALRYFIHTENSKGTAEALYYFLKCTGKPSSEIEKISFLRDLPAEILERNPFLYVGCAWYALLFSDIKVFFSCLDKLYVRIDDIAERYGMFLESILFLSIVDHRHSVARQAAKSRLRSALALDKAGALQRDIRSFPFLHRTFRDFSYYALEREKPAEDFQQMFSLVAGNDHPIIEAGLRAGLLYERNRLKESLSQVTPNPKTKSPELIFLSRLHIASCLFAMGKMEDAARCKSDIKAFVESENLLYLYPAFLAYETKTKLLDGDRAAAAEWLGNDFVNEALDLVRHKLYINFITVRAYIVLGQFQKAALLCEKLSAIFFNFGRLIEEMEASVLLSIITWMTDKKQEAVALLQTVLIRAEPYRLIRVFADEGKAILPILKRLQKNLEATSTPGYKYVREVYLAAYAQSKKHKGIACATEYKPVKLSKQQKYILEFLAKGYKNAEIVVLTGLSINTIRSHTRAVYQKLEVGTAMDAVLRARELELID